MIGATAGTGYNVPHASDHLSALDADGCSDRLCVGANAARANA
jgi:hypothetical protein